MTVTGRLQQLAAVWERRVGPAVRQSVLLGVLTAVLLGAHLARRGTPVWRSLGAALISALLVAALGATWRTRRVRRDARRTIRRVLVPTDRDLAERTLRALGLVERMGGRDEGGSWALADLHYHRLLERATVERVEGVAQRRARRWWWLAAVLLGSVLVVVVAGPMRILEGLDVLLAREGRAPLPMRWLRFPRMHAQPPGYLRLGSERVVGGRYTTSQPAGAVLTVRGVPLRQGRNLLLTDGVEHVPFVSDGAGGVVARWSLGESVDLRVAARFGEVLIEEPEVMKIRALQDEPPAVVLEGAPRRLRLADVDGVQLRYAARDDHGLRQIDLVLRSGDREERRVLARLSGETTSEFGGYVLGAQDPFLRRVFLPVEASVEARDNDPVSGPKWGRSEVITVLPPPVGEPESTRYRALIGARDLLVDMLAWQMSLPEGPDRWKKEKERARAVADEMRAALDASYSGLSVADGLATFLRGQVRVIESRPEPGASTARRVEDTLLAIDVALRRLANRDAQSVSKRLADVADEAAGGAEQARATEQRERGLRRLDTALGGLEEGARQLRYLGELGRDLGSVAGSELRRVQRARARDDLTHAELAARHLAARLRRPQPSAAVVRGGGTESAVGSGPATWGEPSQADDRFDQLASELEQLVEEHNGVISKVERALVEAESGAESDRLRDEARERAAAIRRAVENLPAGGAEPGTSRAAAALGREHATSMAQSLERLGLADAVQSGRDAVSALADARRRQARAAAGADWVDARSLKEAKRRLDAELAWAEDVLRRQRRRVEARARDALERSAHREQGLAQRAGNLSSRGGISQTAMPRDRVADLERAETTMQEAARALGEGKGDRGLELQREAQRLLERASPGRTADEPLPQAATPPQESSPQSGRRGMRRDGNVPEAAEGDRAAEFRQRVLRGLGRQSGGRLAPAVKRYAEGLLR